jgi:nicotinamidase-related amidase
MTKDLGVWTAEDCALVLIDYQNEMFEVIRSEAPADVVELHVRLLARTARAFGMPIVASTVGVACGFNLRSPRFWPSLTASSRSTGRR